MSLARRTANKNHCCHKADSISAAWDSSNAQQQLPGRLWGGGVLPLQDFPGKQPLPEEHEGQQIQMLPNLNLVPKAGSSQCCRKASSREMAWAGPAERSPHTPLLVKFQPKVTETFPAFSFS